MSLWRLLPVLGYLAANLAVGSSAAGPLGGLPALPGQVFGGIGRTTGQLGDDLGNTLNVVQRDLVGRPLVARTFERDPAGDRILRRTVLAIGPTDHDLAVAQQLDFDVVRRDMLTNLGLVVVQLRAPSDLSAIEGLAVLHKADPSGTFDYDHIYDPSASMAGNALNGMDRISAADTRTTRIGMIDGGIARHHPAFEAATLTLKNLASADSGPPTLHGTAIASLLVGSDDDFHGYLPGGSLFAADVFGGQAGGGGAVEIARALDWLAANNVAVVNVSLAGPQDKLLELAVRRFLARGGVIVAAVGNGGPAAPASYPAAYAGVIGVSSVDQSRRLEIDASRHAVTFAALGVEVRAAKPDRGYGTYTGTSFAAPAVAARFALLLAHPDAHAAQRALMLLQKSATPLGANIVATGYGYLSPPPPVAAEP